MCVRINVYVCEYARVCERGRIVTLLYVCGHELLGAVHLFNCAATHNIYLSER